MLIIHEVQVQQFRMLNFCNRHSFGSIKISFGKMVFHEGLNTLNYITFQCEILWFRDNVLRIPHGLISETTGIIFDVFGIIFDVYFKLVITVSMSPVRIPWLPHTAFQHMSPSGKTSQTLPSTKILLVLSKKVWCPIPYKENSGIVPCKVLCSTVVSRGWL